MEGENAGRQDAVTVNGGETEEPFTGEGEGQIS
jgi:hypothetical protein